MTAAIASVTTVPGVKIDQLCTGERCPVSPDFESRANKLMLQQVGASMVHAVALPVVMLVFGGIL